MFHLEVLEYSNKGYKHIGYKHIGYMKKIFKTKEEVVLYYNENNPHMRNINIHKTYKSDWDPINNLCYIVREYKYGIIRTIDGFK